MAYPGKDKPFFIASLAEKTSHNYHLILFFLLFILIQCQKVNGHQQERHEASVH
jgi:hypothetical protein